MVSYHVSSSCVMLLSTMLFTSDRFRTCLVSVSGMLEYMFDMSREARVCDGCKGVILRSCISCLEFLTLKAYGRGDSSLIFCVRDFASLYAGAFFQFTTGRMGKCGLCSFMRPLMEGAEGF